MGNMSLLRKQIFITYYFFQTIWVSNLVVARDYLLREWAVLRRTIIIADKENIIRYVDFVPGGGLPNINKALKAASDLLKLSKTKG